MIVEIPAPFRKFLTKVLLLIARTIATIGHSKREHMTKINPPISGEDVERMPLRRNMNITIGINIGIKNPSQNL